MLGEKLRIAREALRLTLAQVEAETGIGISSLSDFENGKREPRLAQLAKLAAFYRRPVESFLTSERWVAGEQILWRQRPEQAEQIEADFLQLCRWYGQLEAWLDEQPKVNLPEVQSALPDGDAGFAEARRLANEVRNRLELGAYPAFGLLAAMEERCGVKVFCLAFEPSGTAACVRSEQFGVGVLLNRHNKPWRRRFDLAHELFHLITWRGVHGRVLTDSQRQQQEQLADAFASALLLPGDAFEAELDRARADGRLTVAEVIDLTRNFGVSVDAVCWRLRSRFRWDRMQAEGLIERCRAIQRGVRPEEPDALDDRPARFRTLALRAAERGLISTGKLAQYLGISRSEALDLVAIGGGVDEAVQAPLA